MTHKLSRISLAVLAATSLNFASSVLAQQNQLETEVDETEYR